MGKKKKAASGPEANPAEGVPFWLLLAGMGPPDPEYRFALHVGREWRFDFAWPARRLAVEVEGGVWAGGRHTRGAGYTEDCRKYARAALLGWMLLRVTTQMVSSGEALALLEEARLVTDSCLNCEDVAVG